MFESEIAEKPRTSSLCKNYLILAEKESNVFQLSNDKNNVSLFSLLISYELTG